MHKTFRCKICGFRSNNPRVPFSLLSTSVVDTLLSSNDCPTIHDQRSIKGHLLRIQAEMNAMDNAIENLQKACTELERERVKYAGLVSPLCAFPPELLYRIFLACNEDWWNCLSVPKSEDELGGWSSGERILRGRDTGDTALTRVRPMHVVTQVCHRWRAIALDFSALWTDIYVDNAHITNPIAVTQSLRILLDQTNCPKTQPLRIITDIPDGSPAAALYARYFYLLSRYIIPAHRRWMSVRIALADDILPLLPKSSQSRLLHILPLFLKPSEPQLFPCLVSLSIDLQDLVHHTVYNISAADAPFLTEVSLEEGADSSRGLQLPWAQLRKLRLSSCVGTLAFTIIQELRDVEDLALLTLYECDQLPTPPPEPIILPSLRCLKMSNAGCDGSSPAELLHYLRLPVLKTLVWTQMKDDNLPRLNAMFRNTWPDGSSAITELYLHSPHGSMHEYIEDDDTHPLEQLLDSIDSQVNTVEIVYSNPSGFDLDYVMTHLTRKFMAGSFPNLRAFKLQGVLLDLWDMPRLVFELLKRDIDVRFVKCAVSTHELYEGGSVFRTMSVLKESIPGKGHLELDIEGPDSKHLLYSPQTGLRIERGIVTL